MSLTHLLLDFNSIKQGQFLALSQLQAQMVVYLESESVQISIADSKLLHSLGERVHLHFLNSTDEHVFEFAVAHTLGSLPASSQAAVLTEHQKLHQLVDDYAFETKRVVIYTQAENLISAENMNNGGDAKNTDAARLVSSAGISDASVVAVGNASPTQTVNSAVPVVPKAEISKSTIPTPILSTSTSMSTPTPTSTSASASASAPTIAPISTSTPPASLSAISQVADAKTLASAPSLTLTSAPSIVMTSNSVQAEPDALKATALSSKTITSEAIVPHSVPTTTQLTPRIKAVPTHEKPTPIRAEFVVTQSNLPQYLEKEKVADNSRPSFSSDVNRSGYQSASPTVLMAHYPPSSQTELQGGEHKTVSFNEVNNQEKIEQIAATELGLTPTFAPTNSVIQETQHPDQNEDNDRQQHFNLTAPPKHQNPLVVSASEMFLRLSQKDKLTRVIEGIEIKGEVRPRTKRSMYKTMNTFFGEIAENDMDQMIKDLVNLQYIYFEGDLIKYKHIDH